MQADFLQPDRSHLCDLYLTVHDVDGLPPGAYVYHRGLQALEQLKEGDFRSESGYLGLNQDIPADASANIFFLTNLDPVLERMGNRGYRAAQIEASITAGKMLPRCIRPARRRQRADLLRRRRDHLLLTPRRRQERHVPHSLGQAGTPQPPVGHSCGKEFIAKGGLCLTFVNRRNPVSRGPLTVGT